MTLTKEEIKIKRQQYYQDNKERLKEKQRKYRIDNLQQENERSKKWRDENKEKLKEYYNTYKNLESFKEKNRKKSKEYYINNKEEINEKKKIYRDKIKDTKSELEKVRKKINQNLQKQNYYKNHQYYLQQHQNYRNNNKDNIKQKRINDNFIPKKIETKKKHSWIHSQKLKENDERLDYIYNRYLLTDKCDLCNKEFKNNLDKCMEHDHLSGHFRMFCCKKCNLYMKKIDNNRLLISAELNRYFKLLD